MLRTAERWEEMETPSMGGCCPKRLRRGGMRQSLLGLQPSRGHLLGLVSVTIGTRRAILPQLAHVVVGAFAFKGSGALVGSTNLVPQGEVLPVVVVKVEVVVGVVGRAVDDVPQQSGDAIVAVVDGDGPDVDEDVEAQVGDFVQGEEEGVDVVGQALHEAIHGVEGMAGEGRCDLPEVVGFVEALWGKDRHQA